MGIQPGARFPARSADALPATLYGHSTQAIYRNRPIVYLPSSQVLFTSKDVNAGEELTWNYFAQDSMKKTSCGCRVCRQTAGKAFPGPG